MISFKLAATIFITLFSSYAVSFINTVAVFKRWNRTLKRHNYVITNGDVHEGLYHLNYDQIKATKSVVYNSDPNQTLFLVEDIASIKTSHPLLNSVVEAINSTYNNTDMKTRIPLVTLVNYALINKKNAINLDDRAHTLIQTIFYYLVMSYIQKTKYSFTPQHYLSIDYKISLTEVGLVLSDFLKSFENGYLEVSTKLRTLETNAKSSQSQDHSDSLEINDLKHYIEFYNSFSNDIEKDRQYANDLIAKNFDLIDYFVKEYKSFKNIKALNLESPTDGFNFNFYVGSTFLTKMLIFGSYTIELKALKSIIENLNSKPRIFVFTGQKHIENLNQILEKMSFKKIYHKTQTQDISKIYSHITEHIQQAKSFRKVNNKYILKMKQNLEPIDHNFFKICQKKHLYAQDFKDLR